MKTLNLVVGIVFVTMTNLAAFELKNDISVGGGYQHGHFNQDLNLHYQATEGLAPADTEAVAATKAGLDLGIVGLDARAVMPKLDCFCGYPFINNFYLTGHAVWGFSDGNKYSNIGTVYEATGIPVPATYQAGQIATKGKLKDAQTYDFAIGLGYLLDFSQLSYLSDVLNGWALGFEGGYSYHKQALKTKNGNTGAYASNGSHIYEPGNPAFKDSKFHNKWNGGYVGAELFFETCAWDIALGYQYHIVDFRSSDTASPSAFSSSDHVAATLRSDNAHGNVWTAKASYDIWCGLSVGALFNYEYWHAHGGSWRVTSPKGPTFGDIKTSINASWNAWSVAATLSYEF